MDIIHRTSQFLNTPINVNKKVEKTMRYIGFAMLGALFSTAAYNTVARQISWNLDQAKKAAIKSVDKADTFGRVIIKDDGTIVSWNKGMTDITGWTSREMRDGSIDRIIPHDEQLAAERANKLTASTADMSWEYVTLKTRDGQPVRVRLNVKEVPDKTGSGFGDFRFLTVDKLDPDQILPRSSDSSELMEASPSPEP